MIEQGYKYLLFATIALCVSFSFSKMKFDPVFRSYPDAGYSVPDTLNILAFRVEFEDDDLDYTTGTGKFNSGYPDTLKIDGLPHDKAYFEDQLEYVKNYFESQSGSAVHITYTVIDRIDTLSHPIWYYNPNNGSEVLLERLIELYEESWGKIKDDTSINFSDFNTFVLYHAGSGQEFSPGYDETPFDIPSVFLSASDISGSIVTAHDGTLIENTVLLPECEWQIYDGTWYYAGMGGISGLMIAHRLGIPNLYSSGDGRSCIGKFGLMDQGSANFSGMIPSGVSAWVKELKGWSEVRTIELPEKNITAVSDSAIYRIDLNSNEYFLIENRTPVNYTSAANSINGYDRDGRTMRFFYDEDSGAEKFAADPGFRTLVRIDDNDYDFGLPNGYDLDYGSVLPRSKGGLLIWHIDKRMTTAYNIENNLVNDDYGHRGVYLEEADGSFDIGKDYWLFDNGYGTELGWFYDAFSSDNQYWGRYPNKGLASVEFSSVSYPRADTNEGIRTGIKLHGFSSIGREMKFSFSYEDEEEYFSLDPGLGSSVYLPVYAADGTVRHYFCGTGGVFKIYDTDSTFISDSTGTDITKEFLPVQADGTVFTVSADSASVILTDIPSGVYRIVAAPSKIISQPVGRIFAAASGIYRINDDGTADQLSAEFENSENLSVLKDSTGIPVFIKGENNGTLFSIDISGTPYITETRTMPADSVNFSFILTDEGRLPQNSSAVLKSYPEDDGIVRLGWADTDRDNKLESISAEGSVLKLKNENDFYENGFPVETGLGHISKHFMFNFGTVVAVDSSSNYLVVNSGGEFDNSGIRSMNGIGINSGLFGSEGIVYLYNYSGTGILTYHKIGEGILDGYFDMIEGVAMLRPPISGGIPISIISGKVYNWPNPARGDATNFRFFLNKPAEVKIDIYDINGKKVESLHRNFSGSGEWFEMEWNVSSVPSGVYRAVLDFGSEKRKVKAAVIK